MKNKKKEAQCRLLLMDEATPSLYIPNEEEIIKIHNYLIGAHGGLDGIIQSPKYVSEFCKAYMEESGPIENFGFMLSRLSKGHYFYDGNKRTAFFTSRYAALRNGYDLNGAPPGELVGELVKIAELNDDYSRKSAEAFIKRHLSKSSPIFSDYEQFERIILKSIAISNKLAET